MIQLVNKPLKIKNVLRYFRHLGTLEYLGSDPCAPYLRRITPILFAHNLESFWSSDLNDLRRLNINRTQKSPYEYS